MPKYAYVATTTEGQQVKGERDAPDEKTILTMIRQEGHFPVSVTKISESVSGGRVTKQKIPIKPLATFCTQLSTVLRAGVPLATSLEMMAAQIEHPALKLIVEDAYTQILSGRSLYESFYTYSENLPGVFLNMIEAGEASGQLDQCMTRAADTLTRSAKLTGRVKSAMVYPIVLLVLTTGITLLLMTVVIPQFAELFASNENAELPALTTILIGMSNFIMTKGYILIILVVGLIFAIRGALANKKIRFSYDKNKLLLPVIGSRMKKIVTARYARTMVTMISAGIPLTSALEVSARSLNNKFMEGVVNEIVEAVRMGQGMGPVMARLEVFPPMIVHMTKLGEASGELEALLEKTAEFYEEESEVAIQSLMSMMEPALIVLLAGIILPIILGILLPIFSLSDAMM